MYSSEYKTLILSLRVCSCYMVSMLRLYIWLVQLVQLLHNTTLLGSDLELDTT